MEVIEYKKPVEWNQFFVQQKLSSFLQSWEWGEFQKSLGRKIWRLAVVDNNDCLLAVALVIEHQLPFRKNYLYCPRGPIIIANLKFKILNCNLKYKIEELIFNKIKEITKQERAIFFRFDPVYEMEILKTKKIKQVKFIQPKDTWILNLTNNEKDILSQMHYKTRYNIRLAERYGVMIRTANKEEEVKDFFYLLKQAAQKGNFKIYPLDYYKKLFSQLRGTGYERKKRTPFVELYLAHYQDKIIAANLVMFFGNTVVYLFGGSNNEYRSIMAPYLLHWQTIKRAKEMGYHYYDFWGIAPTDALKHPWAGFTRFKKSFGGFKYHYPGTFEWPMRGWWYRVYRLIKRIKG